MNWKANVYILWFGQFMVMMGMTMIIPFMPYYIQEMGVTDPKAITLWSGVIFAGNFVTTFIFQPIWGNLADRYGRKVMILRSGFGMAVTMLLMGFAQMPWQILALRLLNGTISGFGPAATSLVAASTPKERMGFAMGMLQSGTVAGTILGPLIGGAFSTWFGYRPIFYVTSALLAMAAMLAWIFVKETFDKTAAAAQPKQSVWEKWAIIRPMKGVVALFSVTFLIQFALFATMPLMAIYVQHLHGDSPNIALYSGMVAAATGISNMIASPILGRWADRVGAHRILLISLIGAGVALIPHAFVQNYWQLFGLRFLLGVFIGGLIPSVNALLQKNTPSEMVAITYSFNASSLSLGNVLGPILGGLFAGYITIPGVFAVAAVLFLVNAYWVRRVLPKG